MYMMVKMSHGIYIYIWRIKASQVQTMYAGTFLLRMSMGFKVWIVMCFKKSKWSSWIWLRDGWQRDSRQGTTLSEFLLFWSQCQCCRRETSEIAWFCHLGPKSEAITSRGSYSIRTLCEQRGEEPQWIDIRQRPVPWDESLSVSPRPCWVIPPPSHWWNQSWWGWRQATIQAGSKVHIWLKGFYALVRWFGISEVEPVELEQLNLCLWCWRCFTSFERLHQETQEALNAPFSTSRWTGWIRTFQDTTDRDRMVGLADAELLSAAV